jgi:hypothetical protein
LKESQWLSAEKMQLQFGKLRKLVLHAYRQCAHRDRMRSWASRPTTSPRSMTCQAADADEGRRAQALYFSS